MDPRTANTLLCDAILAGRGIVAAWRWDGGEALPGRRDVEAAAWCSALRLPSLICYQTARILPPQNSVAAVDHVWFCESTRRARSWHLVNPGFRRSMEACQRTKRLQECWLWMRRAGKVSVTTGPGEPRDQDVRRWGVRGRDRAVLRQLPRPKADRSTSSELPHWLPMTAKSTGRYSASRRAACAVWPPCRKCCPERGGAASASITPEAQSA